MLLENIPDGCVRDIVSEICQCSLNAIVTPCGIFASHSEQKVRDFLVDAWSPHFRAEFAVVPFVSYQCAMPAKYCFACHNTADVGQYPPTQDLTLNCRSPALEIIQQNSFLVDLFS